MSSPLLELVSTRLCWPRPRERVRKLNTPEDEHGALKDFIMDNDFVHTDVPSIVQLGEHQYDLAVRQRALGKFEYVTSHLKVEPFGDYDGLSTRHGKASAADLAVKTYEAELRRGVPEDQIPWYNNQISWYKDQNSRYQDRVSSPTS